MVDFKKCSPAEFKTKLEDVAKKHGDKKVGNDKERNTIQSILGEGEPVLFIAVANFQFANTPDKVGRHTSNLSLIALTPERIIAASCGLFDAKQLALDLEKIESVAYAPVLLGANVHIQSGGITRTVAGPDKKMASALCDAIKLAAEDKKKRLAASQRGPVAPAADDITSKLERLATLKEKGILTDEEFKEQKMKLLAAM